MKQLPNICTPPSWSALCLWAAAFVTNFLLTIECLDIFKNAAWNGCCEAVILPHWHQKTADFLTSLATTCEPGNSESAPADRWVTIILAALQLHVATSPIVMKYSPTQANNYSDMKSVIFHKHTNTERPIVTGSTSVIIESTQAYKHKELWERNDEMCFVINWSIMIQIPS